MAKDDWYSKFVWKDWMGDPDLKRCSKAAKGVLIDLLALAFVCEECGVVASNGKPWSNEDIAHALGGNIQENLDALGELESNGVISRNEAGAIYSRRMVRDSQKRKTMAERGRKGGLAKAAKDEEASKTTSRTASKTASTEASRSLSKSSTKNLPYNNSDYNSYSDSSGKGSAEGKTQDPGIRIGDDGSIESEPNLPPDQLKAAYAALDAWKRSVGGGALHANEQDRVVRLFWDDRDGLRYVPEAAKRLRIKATEWKSVNYAMAVLANTIASLKASGAGVDARSGVLKTKVIFGAAKGA